MVLGGGGTLGVFFASAALDLGDELLELVLDGVSPLAVKVHFSTDGLNLSNQQVDRFSVLLVLGLNRVALIPRATGTVAVLVANFTQFADLGLHGMQALSQVSIWTLFALFAVPAHAGASLCSISRLLWEASAHKDSNRLTWRMTEATTPRTPKVALTTTPVRRRRFLVPDLTRVLIC